MNSTIEDLELEPSAAQLWRARRDEGLTQDEEAQFKHWLEADIAHREAYLEAEIAWGRLEKGEYERPDLNDTPKQTNVVGFPENRWTHRLRLDSQAVGTRALAASLAVALVAGGMLLTGVFPSWTSSQELKSFSFASSDTATKLVILPDGSRISLKPASRFDAVFSDTERRLALTAGAASFRVEKDSLRPFVVQTGAATVFVTGTWFDTQLRDGGLEVRVREGSVDVRPGSEDSGGVSGSAIISLSAGDAIFTRDGIEFTDLALPVRKNAGSQPAVTQRKPSSTRPAQPEQLVYRSAPLSQVIADINRFSTREVRLDPSASGLTLSGRFKSNEVDSIIATIDAALPVEVTEQDGAQLIVLERAVE
ncbi:MAG: FecR domain-containing protein [Pseudomonadota bacterium]